MSPKVHEADLVGMLRGNRDTAPGDKTNPIGFVSQNASKGLLPGDSSDHRGDKLSLVMSVRYGKWQCYERLTRALEWSYDCNHLLKIAIDNPGAAMPYLRRNNTGRSVKHCAWTTTVVHQGWPVKAKVPRRSMR